MLFEITIVDIACLKISCSWLLASSTTEYLSKLLIRPESFTPLIKYIVRNVLSLRALLRNASCMFCASLSIYLFLSRLSHLRFEEQPRPPLGKRRTQPNGAPGTRRHIYLRIIDFPPTGLFQGDR